jgi:phage baseplate assembly protein gpV
MEPISFGEVKINPFEFISVLYMSINQKMNEHCIVSFRGRVLEEKKDEYIDSMNSNTAIDITVKDKEGKESSIFKGKISNLKIENSGGVYEVIGEAVSHTKDLDIKLKSRSFQNKDMSYDTLFKDISGEYSGSRYIDNYSKGKKIGKFTMQYNESDWEFLKRMASRLNAPLIPIITLDKPSFYLGLPEGGVIEEINSVNYIVGKDIEEFKKNKENSIKDIAESDSMFYIIEIMKFMNAGDRVKFKEKTLYITESETELKKGIINCKYKLVQEKGIKIPEKYNGYISGNSIEGTVLEVQKDKLKLHLEIDEKQDKSTAWMFKYTTDYTGKGSTGWYCMPEINDRVRVYFPSNKEEDGAAVDSVREDGNSGDKISDPKVKYFRTAAGKELMFSQEEIVITGKDGDVFIKLNEKDGISIISSSAVTISGSSNVNISAGANMVITAKEKIDIKCKESTINMDGNVTIKGNNLKAN